jgi:hypothetical protein
MHLELYNCTVNSDSCVLSYIVAVIPSTGDGQCRGKGEVTPAAYNREVSPAAYNREVSPAAYSNSHPYYSAGGPSLGIEPGSSIVEPLSATTEPSLPRWAKREI